MLFLLSQTINFQPMPNKKLWELYAAPITMGAEINKN